jgi:ABC-type dipeptide/oligopeptide/nickel transport system permease component
MFNYFLKRAFMALLVALTVSIVAFVLLNVAVDPAQAIAGEDADYKSVRSTVSIVRLWCVISTGFPGCSGEIWEKAITGTSRLVN